MHIIQVTPRFPPAIGGVEEHVYRISRELVRRGHEVTVVTSSEVDGKISFQRTEVVEGVRVLRFPLFAPRLLREIWFIPSIPRILGKLKGDVIHAHGYRCLSSFEAVYVAHLMRAPIVFTPHGIYPPRSFGNAFLKLVFDRAFGRSLLKHSTKIIALSEHNVELLSQLGAEFEKITIVPNGVSTEEYLSSARSASIRREVGSDGPLLLYVGRIDWNKQIESVVKSMPLIKKDFPEAKFVVVGPDYADYSAELLRLARKLAVEDSLVMAGRVSGQRLREYYSNADVFILPSSYEGFGLSMLEAMISKIPVIVSPTGGPGDILKNRVHAWFLRNTTPEEVSNAVRTVLTNDQLKRDLIKNSFELVSSKYTWKSVVDKLESIYRQVICERGQAY